MAEATDKHGSQKARRERDPDPLGSVRQDSSSWDAMELIRWCAFNRITDVFDRVGSPASTHAITVMREYQIDLSKHRSKLLTHEMCEEADYIVCVSMGHRDKVLELFPRIKDMKGSLCTLSRDVPDPWHMDYDTYMENVALMEELVSEFMDKTFTF
jgi:protein-tyrosine-phosphatase